MPSYKSADQLLTDVLAAVGNERITAAFTNKVEGFDLSNEGDYIYVSAAGVKDRMQARSKYGAKKPKK